MKNSTTTTATSCGLSLISNNYDLVRDVTLSVLEHSGKNTSLSWFTSYDEEAIISEVTDKVITKGDTYDASKGSLRNWVWRIAKHELVNYLRLERGWDDIYRENEDGDLYERDEIAYTITPEDEYVGSEVYDTCCEVLSGRSELDRAVFKMTVEGYKPQEIADELGLTANAVSLRLYKVRKDIQDRLS